MCNNNKPTISQRERPTITESDLLELLRERYGNGLEVVVAKQNLKKGVWRKGKEPGQFAERLEVLYKIAYLGNTLHSAVAYSTLFEIFVDGLTKKCICQILILHKPATLEVLQLAKLEDRLDMELLLRGVTEEPMEIEAVEFNDNRKQFAEMMQ